YHTLSVGRDDGNHSAGLTTIDGAGRIKPDIVAPSSDPEYATSWTTPMVAGTAGLLHAKLAAAPISLSGADLPRVIKALLLASATKDTVPDWNHSPSAPLDSIYGAGELNAYHAYSTLRSGRATASKLLKVPARGWAAEAVSSSASKTYYFSIPAGATATPFCAALTWHRVISKTFLNIWSATLANLTLRFYHANGFTLGSEIAASTSTVDNVELIHHPALAAGTYALVVQSAASAGTPYALAWHSLPTVSVAATLATAREIDGQSGLVTVTRSGDTSLPLWVPLTVNGSAISGSHFQPLPASITLPANAVSTTLAVIPIADALAQGDRSLVVGIAADFALVRDPAQTAVVTIQDKPFDAWRFANFTGPELLVPAISAELADPDADQLANLLEYALGLAPKSASSPPLAMIDLGGYLALYAAKNPAATDITWAAQVAGDLLNWQPAVVPPQAVGTFVARDTVLKTSALRRFIRLQITR
ncbi:hypothetical protein HQ447_01910, partial [bacterium]|nr:hypothetical protein [bacterium]